MAAGTTTPPGGARPTVHNNRDRGLDGKLVEFDHYIESQIHRTRRQVKGVDLSASLMVLAVGTLAYLMLVALVDHWLVSGGLGFGGRLTAFLLLTAGIGVFTALKIAPLLLRRINPVYAAHTIERNRPGIKNSLINFLLLRSSPAGLAPRVYEAMEVQAVNALTSVHSDVPIDRTPLIRLLLALVGIVTCLALYGIISPKSPFASIRRVVAPWSDVAPPTRVRISDVQPGDATGFHDQHVAVSAEVSGVRSGESVTLYYSTLDGQVVRRAVPMNLPANSYRHTAELPPDNLGLQQDLEYWIEAGDAASSHHHIKVQTPPTILVEAIEYEYPKYSELPPQRVTKHGDLQALEGTRVSLAAAANQDIRRANLDFECDGRNDLAMKTDGRQASVAFNLGWDAKNQRPEHQSYQLRFLNGDGHENPKPIRYTIDVIRDLPPEIALVEPQADPAEEISLKAGASLRLTVQASDPDFKLAAVTLHARRSGLRLLEERLLAEPRAGQFKRDYLLDSRKLALKPGDTVEFWASADDNKQPEANHAETPHYTLRIVSPDARPRPDQLAKNDPPRKPDDRDQQPPDGKQNPPPDKNHQQPQDQQQGEQGNQGGAQGQDKDQQQRDGAKGDQGQAGEGREGNEGQSGKNKDAKGKQGAHKQPGEGKSGERGEGTEQDRQGKGADQQDQAKQGQGKQPADEEQRVDPNRDPGKAFEKILEHLKQNQQPEDQQQQPQSEKDGQAQKPEQNESGDPSAGKEGQPKGMQKEPGSQGKQDQSNQRQPQEGQEGQEPKDEPGAKSGAQQKQSSGRPNEAGENDQPNDGKQQGPQRGSPKKGKSSQDPSAQPRDGEKPDDKQAGQQNKSPAGEQRQGAPGGDGDQAKGQKAPGEQPLGKAKTGEQSSEGEEKQAEQPGGVNNDGAKRKPQAGDGDASKREAEGGDESAKHADGEQQPQQGKGDQARGFGEPDEKNERDHGVDRDRQGGDPESKEKGDGGAGQEGESRRGASSPMHEMQPKEKKQTSPTEKTRPLQDEDPAAASESKKSSDSQGEQSGDQAGGGNASGGQHSNSPGVGSAGQNTASEQGGGQSEQKGKGVTGKRGGDQVKGQQPADGGKASNEKGAGSHQRQGGDKSGGRDQAPPEGADQGGAKDEAAQPRDDAGAKPSQPGKQPGKGEQPDDNTHRDPAQPNSPQRPGGQPRPSDKGGHDVQPGQPASGRANPTAGGGTPPEQPAQQSSPSDDDAPKGDDPKLEYTRKATELVLNKLQDQVANNQVDPELLEKLKWTPEDMQRFLRQWRQLKQAADESGPRSDAARELDEALRSLGLRPRGSSLEGAPQRGKAMSGLREGQRTAPPPEYREQYREFSKAKAQGLKKPQ
ncbi:MAG TPA: hypothetical protein VF306_13130 [Pirellulales bacterium]